MKILRILLAAAALAGAAFFGFCAWALWGPFRSVAAAALLAAVLCLAGGVAALLAGPETMVRRCLCWNSSAITLAGIKGNTRRMPG